MALEVTGSNPVGGTTFLGNQTLFPTSHKKILLKLYASLGNKRFRVNGNIFKFFVRLRLDMAK